MGLTRYTRVTVFRRGNTKVIASGVCHERTIECLKTLQLQCPTPFSSSGWGDPYPQQKESSSSTWGEPTAAPPVTVDNGTSAWGKPIDSSSGWAEPNRDNSRESVSTWGGQHKSGTIAAYLLLFKHYIQSWVDFWGSSVCVPSWYLQLPSPWRHGAAMTHPWATLGARKRRWRLACGATANRTTGPMTRTPWITSKKATR